MKSIRKGKDISVVWPILTNGEPLALGGRDLSLRLRLPQGDEIDMPFSVEANIIAFEYYGRDQKWLGVYGLTLYENYGKVGQSAVDVCEVFELVALTCCEGGEDDACCTSESVTLESGNIEFIQLISDITPEDIDNIMGDLIN